jgi:hypothetical protein
VKGNAVEGASKIGSQALTMSFDMESPTLPNVTLILVHCDRDWRPTENIFVQDIMHLRTSDFTIERAPIGVHGYDFSLSITFPRVDGVLKIEYSGNYRARVVDYYDNTKVYTEARFIAVEPKSDVDVGVYQDFYESTQTDVVQHGLRVRAEAVTPNDLFSTQIKAIQLYRSGEWLEPMTASQDNARRNFGPGQVWTDWSGYIGTRTVAEFRNLPSGNEHRLLDLTDISLFPATGGILTTPLSDLPRSGFSAYDNNGMAISRFVPLRDAEYVYFEFRLELKGTEVKQDLAVVGTFNDWKPTREWRMYYDQQTGFYIARGWVKRALHEYQYVAGTWDEDAGILRDADATLLEGNSSMSTQRFLAFVYYRESTAGGYDRVIGAGSGAI